MNVPRFCRVVVFFRFFNFFFVLNFLYTFFANVHLNVQCACRVHFRAGKLEALNNMQFGMEFRNYCDFGAKIYRIKKKTSKEGFHIMLGFLSLEKQGAF